MLINKSKPTLFCQLYNHKLDNNMIFCVYWNMKQLLIGKGDFIGQSILSTHMFKHIPKVINNIYVNSDNYSNYSTLNVWNTESLSKNEFIEDGYIYINYDLCNMTYGAAENEYIVHINSEPLNINYYMKITALTCILCNNNSNRNVAICNECSNGILLNYIPSFNINDNNYSINFHSEDCYFVVYMA